MDFTGSYMFQVSSQRVFTALLDPAQLKEVIPGCEAAWHADESHMVIRLALPIPIPGLQGPYDVKVIVKESQEPRKLVLQVGRTGRIGGKVDTLTDITLSDSADGSLLKYATHVDLEGPIAMANNPMFHEIIKYSLNTFMKNLNTKLKASAPSFN